MADLVLFNATVWTGNPVRPELFTGDRTEAQRLLRQLGRVAFEVVNGLVTRDQQSFGFIVMMQIGQTFAEHVFGVGGHGAGLDASCAPLQRHPGPDVHALVPRPASTGTPAPPNPGTRPRQGSLTLFERPVLN